MLYNKRTAVVPYSRNCMVRKALKDGATWLLWIEHDMSFPPDTAERLLSHHAPIVGANYQQRSLHGHGEALVQLDTTRVVQPIKPILGEQKLQQVHGVGLGLTLTSAAVFQKIPEPWFEWWMRKGKEAQADCFVFCAKAREAGYKIFIDRGLSNEVLHWGTIGLGPRGPQMPQVWGEIK